MSRARDLQREIDARRIELVSLVERMRRLDSDPVRRLLAEADLTGASAKQWNDAEARLADLWTALLTISDRFDQLDELRNRPVRRRRRWARAATVLVTAPGVEPTVRTGARLGARDERDLQTLLADQSAGLGDAESSVARVTWAWTTARRALADASRNLDEAVERAQQAHVRVPVTVRQTSGSVQAATSRASHDPLDVDPEHVQAVLAEVGTRIEELSGALRERAAFDDRLATTTGDLDDASRLVTDLRSRWRDVRRRVAVESCSDDRLDELDHRLSGLRGQVAGLAEVANVDWAATGRRLTHVQDAIRSVRQDAMTTDAQLTAALAERDVLRGRLSAYQARAARSHRAEDPDLDVRFEAAYETLHRAPVDLIRAAALVHAYVACLEQVEVRP